LIFVRTAEDRQVEPPRLLPLLRELEERDRVQRLPAELARLFREFDEVYNSDLFAPHFSEDLDCEPEPFRILIEGLHQNRDALVRYNFNAIDADVLGTAYEQYLGHVIADPEAAEVVERRRKRKAQGIYYTPTFIVKYIVQQTLGRHLEEHPYSPARPVRVLDMACGSGSFLIEALDTLDRHVAQLRAQTRGAGDDFHDHVRRVELLGNCLYGVDKDEQAVSVAKLNLSLKALHTRDRLPMLANIRCGDSLITGRPEELEGAFGKDWGAKKPFEWQQEFPEVFRDGGFDVIVGNPPYVRANNMDKAERAFWQTSGHFRTITGKFDIFILFLERAISLLRTGGRLGFIIPHPFLSQNYAQLVRRLILDTCSVESVLDLSRVRVFQDAAVSTCILVLRREPDPGRRAVSLVTVLSTTDPKDVPQSTTVPQEAWENTFQSMFRLSATDQALALSEKLWVRSQPLSDLCYVGVGMDVHNPTTGADKSARIFPRPKGKAFKPYVEGKEVDRYLPPQWSRYIHYLPEAMHRPKYPEMFEIDKILARIVVGREGIVATLDRESLYAEQTLNVIVPKHILASTGRKDTETTPDQVRLSRAHSLPYILGLLCSRTVNWYFSLWLSDELHVVPENLRQLPIRVVDFGDPVDRARHDQLVRLVEEMLRLQAEHAEAERNKEDRPHGLKKRIEEIDRAIDALVYVLYDLTPEEIRLVERA
ncbi:MAG: N-6 DNA methylase, partial [Chloroflexota bacterium]